MELMEKREINDSIFQALRFEFDTQNTTDFRLIEIALTVKSMPDFYDDFKEMVSDLKIDGKINPNQEKEMLN